MSATADITPPGTVELRSFHGPAGVVRSDFPFHDLEAADPKTANVVELLADEASFPPRGARVRSVTHASEHDLRLEIYEDDRGVQWDVSRLGRFWINSSGTEVRYCLESGASRADVESLFVGPVLATAAQLRGELMLHASAITVDGDVVAFAGPQGRGKSTISAAFASSGRPHFSDDVLHLRGGDDQFEAERYLPTIRLWEQTIEALGVGQPGELERVVSWADKRRLPVPEQHSTTPRWRPLRAIYLLAGPEAPGTKPSVHALSHLDACLRLQAAMYGAHWMPPLRAAESLPMASALAAGGLVRELSYAREFESLEALQSTVLEDLQTLP